MTATRERVYYLRAPRRYRARTRRNPSDRSASIAARAIAFGSGFGFQWLLNRGYQFVESEQARLQRYGSNQIGFGDVFVRGVAPLTGAFFLARASDLLSGGLFMLGAIVNSGGVTIVDGWPLLKAPVETATDLGPYGAAGFAWDQSTTKVFAIREGPVLGLAGYASSRDEAVSIARQFFG